VLGLIILCARRYLTLRCAGKDDELLEDHDANTLSLVSCGYIFQMSKIQGLLQVPSKQF
jgi:hypothetical protein